VWRQRQRPRSMDRHYHPQQSAPVKAQLSTGLKLLSTRSPLLFQFLDLWSNHFPWIQDLIILSQFDLDQRKGHFGVCPILHRFLVLSSNLNCQCWRWLHQGRHFSQLYFQYGSKWPRNSYQWYLSQNSYESSFYSAILLPLFQSSDLRTKELQQLRVS